MAVVGAQIHYDQAKQLFATGQLDKALREIDKGIERFPVSADYHLLRGRILLEQSRLEAALESFSVALEKNPQLADAQYYAGVVYQRWSDDEQAYSCYSAAARLQPDKVHYLLAAVESLIALGELEAAQQMIQPRLAYFEHNSSLRQLQAQIAMLRGEPKTAATLYAEARMLNPDDPMLLEEMMWAQYAAGMYSACHESAGVLRSMDTSTGERPDLAHLQARCLAMMGRGVEAREIYIQLSKSRAADPSVWSELGTLSWELGDFRTLAQASVQLMAIAPDRYEGYLFRAVNERHKGNTTEAVRLFQQACERAQGIALPFLLLGQSLEHAGDPTAAAVAYNRALQAEPDSAQARAFLSRLSDGQQVTAVPVE